MQNIFASPSEAASLIETGAVAVFAGSESLLRQLPLGSWIGGTTPYFMTEHGGVVDTDHLFCTVISEAAEILTVTLDGATLPQIVADRFDNGFTFVLLPAFSDVHRSYAIGASNYSGLCDQPVMGWVTGVLLCDVGIVSPKVVDGRTGRVYDDMALAMHVRLPAGMAADVNFINLFSPGDGPEFVFPIGGFSVGSCRVDGREANFARYVTEGRIDIRLPLVADFAGGLVNVSVQAVDAQAGTVAFFAPVMGGEGYHFARPISDYCSYYARSVGHGEPAGAMLACNNILNFIYARLDGSTTGGFVGPVTFGEIAYVLLNQTLVRLGISHS